MSADRTPAPVAVSVEIDSDDLRRHAELLADEGEHGPAHVLFTAAKHIEAGGDIPEWMGKPAAPRPEPVVAPLPTEAVDEEDVTVEEDEQQQDRIRAIQKHIDDHLSDLDGVQNWGDGYVLVGEWPVDFLAQSIAESMDYNLVAPIVRLTPEGDEDTVLRQWADWIEGGEAAAGLPEPFTLRTVIDSMRSGRRPFGVMAGPADGPR